MNELLIRQIYKKCTVEIELKIFISTALKAKFN